LNVSTLNFQNATATGQWRVFGNVGIGPAPVVNGNNVMMINTSNQTPTVSAGFSAFEIVSDDGAKSDFFFRMSSSAAAGYPSVTLARSNGSPSAPTVVTNGMTIGEFAFNGYDGATWQYVAGMRSEIDGAPGVGDLPTRLAFFTSPDGTVTETERLRITNAGFVGIGTTAPTNFLLTVAGDVGPSVNNAFFLGSSTNTWRGVFATGMNFTNATGTNATTTNFAATGLLSFASATGTSLNANSASFATATVGGVGVCLSNGTFCAPATSADALLAVTNRGAVATSTLFLYGGFISGSSTVTSTLNVNGNLIVRASSSFTGLDFLTATGTSVTTTNIFATNLFFASATGSSVTTTQLFWNNASATNLFLSRGLFVQTSSTFLNATTGTFAYASSSFATFGNATSIFLNAATATFVNASSVVFAATTGTFNYASSVSMFSASATFISVTTSDLKVNGKNVCLEDGTNCPGDKTKQSVSSTTLTITTALQDILAVTTTPATASTTVWIVASIDMTRAAAGSLSLNIQRGTGCTAGVSLYQATSSFSTNAERHEMILSYVDTPATTTVTGYHLCAITSAVNAYTINRRSIVVTEVRQGADLGEVYYTQETGVMPGTVVSLNTEGEALVSKTTVGYDQKIIGIISTRPGLLLSESPRVAGTPVIVALSGRVPVRVSTTNGVIRAGDYLTSSPVAGVAMKATKAGTIIGQALTAYDGEDEGQVMVFIKNGFWNGQSVASDRAQSGRSVLMNTLASIETPTTGASSTVSTLNADRVVAAQDVVAKSFVGEGLAVQTIDSLNGELKLQIGATGTLGLYTEGTASPVLSVDASGVMSVNDLVAQQVSSTRVTTDQLFAIDIQSPSFDAIRASVGYATSGIAELTNRLTDFSDRLASLEQQLTELRAVTSTTAGDSLQIGQLRVVESSEFQGEIRAPGGLRVDTLNAIGDLLTIAGNVEFTGPIMVNRDTAGFAVIKTGMKRVRIAFEQPYLVKPVVQANVNFETLDDENPGQEELRIQNYFDQNMRYVVTRVTKQGFEIWFDKPVQQDVAFSWFAVAPKNAEAVLSTDLNEVASIPSIIEPPTTPPVETESEPEPALEPVDEPVDTEVPSEEPVVDEVIAAPEPTPEEMVSPEPVPEPVPEPTPEPTPEPAPEAPITP
jgi:hypothetical protein